MISLLLFTMVAAAAAPAARQAQASADSTLAGVTVPDSGGAMFSRAPAEAWSQVLGFLKDAQFTFDRLDEREHFVITAPVEVTTRRFGFDASAINPNYRNARVQLHVFVSPYASPARVYIGSVIEVTSGPTAASHFHDVAVREYNAAVIGRWFLRSIGARLGGAGESIPTTLANREALAERLSPGSTSQCQPNAVEGPKQPKPVYTISPVYPADSVQQGATARVMVEGTIFEDGHFQPSRILPPSVEARFAAAALGATSLWVYEPGYLAGCPKPTVMTTQTAFTLK